MCNPVTNCYGYSDIHSNPDTYSHQYSKRYTNSYISSDPDANSNYNSYCYNHRETFSYAQTRTNAQAASHASTAPLASIDEKQMHCSASRSCL